eukprot:g2219.t1
MAADLTDVHTDSTVDLLMAEDEERKTAVTEHRNNPGIISYADDGNGGNEYIKLDSLQAVAFATLPGSIGLSNYTMKLTENSGRITTLRTSDMRMMRQWEMSIICARAAADGVRQPTDETHDYPLGSRTMSVESLNSSTDTSSRIDVISTYGRSSVDRRASSAASRAESYGADEETEEAAVMANEGPPADAPYPSPPTDELADGEATKLQSETSQDRAVPTQWNRACEFSVPLEYQRKTRVASYTHPVPVSLVSMATRLRASGGLESEGIFRITPNRDRCKSVKDRVARGETCEDCDDPHIFAHLIKQFFRDLPCDLMEGLLKDVSIDAAVDDCMGKSNVGDRDAAMTKCLSARLDSEIFSLLLWLLDLISRVAARQDQNRMGPAALSIVFAPNLLKVDIDDISDPMAALQINRRSATLLEKLIWWRLGQFVYSQRLVAMSSAEVVAHLKVNVRLPGDLCRKVQQLKITGSKLHHAVLSFGRFGVFPTAFDDLFQSSECRLLQGAIEAGLLKGNLKDAR